MDPGTAALAIAAVSLLVAGLSLGWQIAQWLLSAGRPKATLMAGIQQGTDVIAGPVPKSGTPIDLKHLRRQGFNGAPIIGVKVVNHGRSAVTVESVSLCVRGSGLALSDRESLGPPLPHLLAPGTNAAWYLDAGNVPALVAAARSVDGEEVSGVYMAVDLAAGKRIQTPRSLRS